VVYPQNLVPQILRLTNCGWSSNSDHSEQNANCVTGGRLRKRGSILHRQIFFSPCVQTASRVGGSSVEAGTKSTAHRHLVPRLELRGSIAQLPPYIFLVWGKIYLCSGHPTVRRIKNTIRDLLFNVHALCCPSSSFPRCQSEV